MGGGGGRDFQCLFLKVFTCRKEFFSLCSATENFGQRIDRHALQTKNCNLKRITLELLHRSTLSEQNAKQTHTGKLWRFQLFLFEVKIWHSTRTSAVPFVFRNKLSPRKKTLDKGTGEGYFRQSGVQLLLS